MSHNPSRQEQSFHAPDSYPLNSWEQAQRGRAGYQVASGNLYIPDFRDRSISPVDTGHRSPSPYQAQRPSQQTQHQQTGHPLPVPPPHASLAPTATPQYRDASPYRAPQDTRYHGYEPPSPLSPEIEQAQPRYPYGSHPNLTQNPSFSSQTGLAAAAALPPHMRMEDATSRSSLDEFSSSQHPTNQGYGVYPARSVESPVPFGAIDPDNIDDDDDIWGSPRSKKNKRNTVGPGAAALALSKGARDTSGSYNAVSNPNGTDGEKNQWLLDEARKRKRRKWLVLGVIGVIVVAAVVGGAIGAVITTRASNALEKPSTDNEPALTKDSAAIKALMNNPSLHKVFPGMDYTPINTQYPACLASPPSQNNVTKDIAVLSQLTPEIRLYGTDCNQTEMVLHAIDILGLGTDMKVWLGVWQDDNSTTNARQLQQMYDVLDGTSITDPISGVVVGNEVLYSKHMSEAQLIDVITGVRSNLTSRGMKLPVATSDLGSNWTPTLAAAVDVVMANVHPFFGGVAVADAASWTWSFWQDHDVSLTSGTDKKHTISEVGWPSTGGNDCGGLDIKCPDATSGSVAGIDEMNTFMSDWVCQSLSNQTSYFWFEAFDEPWKIQFDSPGQEWEDKWGLMDVNRNVKKGLTIPDCGGQTAGPTTWPAPMAS